MKFMFYLVVIVLILGLIMSITSFFTGNSFAMSSLLTILISTALLVTLITNEDYADNTI